MRMSLHNQSRGLRAAARALAFFSAFAALGVASNARADAIACTDLHASAQRETQAGHLKAASMQFRSCASDETCPQAVRSDCTERYEAVERLIPTVIFSVVDETGMDVTNVKVFSGQESLVEALDGRAIRVDPGKHQFRFDLPWGDAQTLDVIVREGEKGRLVNLTTDDPTKANGAPVGPAPTPASTVPLDSPPADVAPASRTPAGFWIAAGVGVAATASFTTFALMGRSKHSDLADCSPSCEPGRQDDYDAMKRNYLIADISAGAAVVSFGVAAIVFFTSGSSSSESLQATSPSRAPRFTIVPSERARGATLLLSGTTF